MHQWLQPRHKGARPRAGRALSNASWGALFQFELSLTSGERRILNSGRLDADLVAAYTAPCVRSARSMLLKGLFITTAALYGVASALYVAYLFRGRDGLGFGLGLGLVGQGGPPSDGSAPRE